MVIEWFMFGALGFFLGCLLGLMLAPPLWNRAVKLTTRRLEATLPMTLAEIQADKDQQRAKFAIQLRKVEVALDKSKEKAARELIEANKRKMKIQHLKEELKGAKDDIQENENANRVLQQTIKRRQPNLDGRLKAAKKALTELETVNAELRNTVGSQSEALKAARATVHNQRADIDRLRMSLESGGSGRGSGKSSGRAAAEAQRLTAELSRVEEELERTRVGTEDIAFLRRELNTLASHIMSVSQTQPAAHAQETHDAGAAAEAADAEAASARALGEMTTRGEFFGSRHAHAGNGCEPLGDEPLALGGEPHAGEPEPGEPEPVMEPIDMAVEAAERVDEMAYADDTRAEENANAEEDARSNLAQRFAARRAKRAEKSGGGSLTSRFRNLRR